MRGSKAPESISQNLTVSSLDEAYILTLREILQSGDLVTTGSKSPVISKELIAHQVTITDPRARILRNSSRKMNLVGAIARLVWLISGNSRVEDIAWYEERVRSYSDDGLNVPGSNYGARIFQAMPGINQVQGALAAMQKEPGTRRAGIVIWQPTDATRTSNDIPCAYGMLCSPRNGRLVTTMIMRSNNAFLLFPYNVFEFSFLAEMIACSAGLELGSYTHFANSMHIFENQISAAETILSSTEPTDPFPMPAMPSVPDPFQQANTLARLEAKMRHSLHNPENLYEDGEALHNYWRALYNILLAYSLRKVGKDAEASRVQDALPDYLR